MAKAIGKIVINKESCKGCEVCIYACPAKTITLSEHLNMKGYRVAEQTGEGCVGCATCGLLCPEGCITVYKEAK